MNTQFSEISTASQPHIESDIEGETPALARYLQIIWRRRLLIAAILGTFLILSIVATLVATKLFTATTTIEISRQDDNIVQVDGLQPEVSTVDQEFYQTQYSLLESEALADRAIDEMNLTQDANFLEMFNIEQGNAGMFADANSGQLTADENTTLRRDIREALVDNISISPIRGSRIVNVSFTSPDSNLSARVANVWIQSYIKSNFDRKLQSTAFATDYLQTQLAELRDRLEKSERDLVEYANRNRIITINPGMASAGSDAQAGSISDANLAELNRSFAAAKAARIVAEGRMRQGAANENLTNLTLTELRKERAILAAKRAELLTTFEPEFPQVKALTSQIANIDRSLSQEESRVAGNLRESFQAALFNEARLDQAVNQLEEKNLDQRRRGIQYNIYQREVDTNRELYDGLLQRFKEIGLSAGIGPNNIAIVDAARPPEKPSSPSLFRNLLLGLVLGLAGSSLAIFVVEQFNKRIRSPEDVEQFTKYPVLGVIPQSSDEELEDWHDVKSGLSESYMSAQAALRLTTDHGVPKSLMFTSTGPGEGKSLSCLALARALTASGKKVVVIDADLRLPSIHKKASVSNVKGFTDYLAGQSDWRELTQDSEIGAMKIITSGAVPPNPAELLTGERLPMLIAALLEEFDHVLVDSPPVLGLADAPLLSEQVEGCIFVIQANGVNGQDAQAALARLSRNARRIVGILLTKYEPEGSLLSYSSHYSYEYGYGKNA